MHCEKTGKALEQRLHQPPPKRSSPSTKVFSEPRHPLLGKLIDGKYRVLERLGGGGNGEVFEAEDELTQRRVAIKVVWNEAHDDSTIRLRREAHVIASIHHPNICALFDVGSLPDGSPYLVLERLYGQTLYAAMRKRPRLSRGALRDVFRQLLTAIHVAHSAGILHRDLKPANVFLVRRAGPRPYVKLLDFGFAKDMSGRFQGMTHPGRVCGTPTYMSPEQLLGRPVDATSDLFSMGIMLFEALSGCHPFYARSVAQTSMNIVQRSAVSLRSICPTASPELEEVLRRVLAKAPGSRFPSALEMKSAVMRAFEAEDLNAEIGSGSAVPSIATGTHSACCPPPSSSQATPRSDCGVLRPPRATSCSKA
jgi:serine/threonine-protein kinase